VLLTVGRCLQHSPNAANTGFVLKFALPRAGLRSWVPAVRSELKAGAWRRALPRLPFPLLRQRCREGAEMRDPMATGQEPSEGW